MNTFKISFVPILILISSIATADSNMDSKGVKYVGHSFARQACQAVVNDNAAKLHRVLMDYRSTKVYAYTLKLNSKAIAGSFTCNGLALAPFSEEIGAQNVAQFLRTGKVSIEPVVASSNN